MYRFPSPLNEGAMVSRPNRFIMMVRAENEILKCHCPTTGRIGDLNLVGLPCLYSTSVKSGRKTSHTVEAISANGKGCWIGINQTGANRYMEHFLRTGALSRMVSGNVEREVTLGDSRIDFLVGNAYVEVKTPLITLPASEEVPRVPYGRFESFDRLIKHMTELRKSAAKGKRALVVLCYLYDAKPFRPPAQNGSNSRILQAARLAEEAGVENWQVILRVERRGVSLVRYFRNRFFP